MSFDGEERPEGEEEDLDASFQFFLELAKLLVLELPSPEDNSLAAAWVTRLEVDPETDEEKRLRVDYLKLLLFVMQRGRLIGIFKNEPPEEALQPFPQGFGLAEMGNLLLEQAELQGSGDANAAGVTYSVEISNDLKEFVAAQEIPDFGVQVYYAWSMEDPIHKWSSFDEKKFPHYVRDKIRLLKTLNSEEKTNVQSNSQGDSLARKSCDSDIYDKTKAKVKSPQEIEKILERSSHKSGSPSLPGSPKEGDKDWPCGRKSRSNSKKNSPEGSPRKMEQDITRLCRRGFQESEEDDCDFEEPSGGMRGRGQDKSGGCGCGQHYRRQEPETSKRLQKCDNGADNGGAFPNEVACMAGSGPRNADRYGGDMYPDNPKCGGENMNREKPICPAAQLYLMNQGQAPTMKSRKTKCATQGNASQQQTAAQDPCGQQQRPSRKSCSEDPGKKCNYSKPSSGKTCSSPLNSPQPCTCSCPREEKETRESPCPKKKSPSEKSCSKPLKTTCPEGSPRQRRPLPPDEDGQTCNTKMPYQMPFDNVNHVEGCTCLDGQPPRRLEGLSRLGLGKTTPDPCITDVKPPQQQPCPTGRRKGGERQDKRQQLPCQPSFNQEDGMPASCLKTRPAIVGEQVCEANKKGNSCPPPRTKPSNMNSACFTQMKQDNYGPSRPEYGGFTCGAKIPDDMGTCGAPACGERNFQDKRYETEVKNLQYTPKQECGQVMTPPGKRQFGNESYGNGKEEKIGMMSESMFQEMISPITPREFIDVLSFSSAEDPPCNLADYRDADGQDDACNIRNGDDAAGEDDDDEDIGTGTGGYSSSSDNVQNGGAGQNFDDYEGNECQKAPPRRRPCTESPESQSGPQQSLRMPAQQFNMPCNLGNGPGPTPFNSPPPNYKPPGTPYPVSFGGGNPPCAVPYNSPNYNQMGQPYPMLMGGPAAFSTPQGGYNQAPPPLFSMPYSSDSSSCSYSPSQLTYSQMKAGQTFTIPGNQSGPTSYGPPQGSYNQGHQQFLHPNACTTPSRQRQTPEMRSGDGSRRGMSVDPREFPHSMMEGYQMPTTSTPYSTSAPPPPDFYLSPITDSPQSQWMRMGPGTPCPRSQTPSEGPVRCGGESMDSKEWKSLRSAKPSTIGKSYNRSADQSSDLKSQIEPDSLEGSRLVCQHGNYEEESPKWRALPKSTRFPRNPVDRNCYK